MSLVTLALSEPSAVVTIPIGVVFVALVVMGLARKLIKLAVLAAVAVALVLAYQAGLFDRWAGGA